jgi:pimeloyl-ACP methyl ester carboxylesterase
VIATGLGASPGSAREAAAQTPEPWVVAHGDTVAVTIAGSGMPVVIVPGMLGGAYGFRRIVPALVAAGYRVIIVEPLGTGASGRPGRADYTLEGHAARTAEVLDRAGVSEAIVVGHSISASIALRLALVRPDLVARIVSINGGPAEQAGTPGLRNALRFAPIVRLLGSGLARRHIRAGLQNSSADAAWVTDEVIAAYTAPFGDDLDAALRALRGFANARERQTLGPRLHDVDVPVHLLIGANMQLGAITPDEIQTLTEHLPQFTMESVAGAGQYIHEEQPASVIDAVINGANASVADTPAQTAWIGGTGCTAEGGPGGVFYFAVL